MWQLRHAGDSRLGVMAFARGTALEEESAAAWMLLAMSSSLDRGRGILYAQYGRHRCLGTEEIAWIS